MISFREAVSALTPQERVIAATREAIIDNAILAGHPRVEPIRVDVEDVPAVVLGHLHNLYRAGGWNTEVKEPAGTRGVVTFILTGR